MSKAFVVMNPQHQPVSIFLIPDMHTTSHHLGQLQRAAEEVGRYGMIIEAQECGAQQAADIIKRMEPERTHR